MATANAGPVAKSSCSVPEALPVVACWLNVAVTVFAASIVTVHVPVPEHPPPLQPAKVEPDDTLAYNVTGIP